MSVLAYRNFVSTAKTKAPMTRCMTPLVDRVLTHHIDFLRDSQEFSAGRVRLTIIVHL